MQEQQAAVKLAAAWSPCEFVATSRMGISPSRPTHRAPGAPWAPRTKGWLSGILAYDGMDTSAGWLGLPNQMWKSLAVAVTVLLVVWLLAQISWNTPEHAREFARQRVEERRRMMAGKGVRGIIGEAIKGKQDMAPERDAAISRAGSRPSAAKVKEA